MQRLFMKVCIFLVILIPIILIIFFLFEAADRKCYHYVEEFVDNANLYNLNEYIDYSMLNKEIKEYVSEDDLQITSDNDILVLFNKIKKMNEQDLPSKSGKYSTTEFRHSAFWAEIRDKTIVYHISFEFQFSPRLFHEPQLRNLTVSISEINISND